MYTSKGGYVIMSNPKVEVECSVCHKKYSKAKASIPSWNGKCMSCHIQSNKDRQGRAIASRKGLMKAKI